MISRDEAFAQGWRLTWLWCPITGLIAICLLLSGCGEPASCWSEQKATFRPCDEVRADQINQEIDKREMERGR